MLGQTRLQTKVTGLCWSWSWAAHGFSTTTTTTAKSPRCLSGAAMHDCMIECEQPMASPPPLLVLPSLSDTYLLQQCRIVLLYRYNCMRLAYNPTLWVTDYIFVIGCLRIQYLLTSLLSWNANWIYIHDWRNLTTTDFFIINYELWPTCGISYSFPPGPCLDREDGG